MGKTLEIGGEDHPDEDGINFTRYQKLSKLGTFQGAWIGVDLDGTLASYNNKANDNN